MQRFITFLGEAFPPPKKKPFGAKPGGGGSKPPFGKKPVQPIKKADEGVDAETDKTAELDNEDGMQQGADALAQMQQAQQEREAAEAQARKQQQAIEDAERLHVKKLRAQADDEVAAALEDKFNAEDDQVNFYPELLTFGQYTANSNAKTTSPADGGSTAGEPGGPGIVGQPTPEKEVRKKKGEPEKQHDVTGTGTGRTPIQGNDKAGTPPEKKGSKEVKKEESKKPTPKKKLKEGVVLPFVSTIEKSTADEYANLRIGYLFLKGNVVQLAPRSGKRETWRFDYPDEAREQYHALYRVYRDEGYQ